MAQTPADTASEGDLLPRPRRVRRLAGRCDLSNGGLAAQFDPSDRGAVEAVESTLGVRLAAKAKGREIPLVLERRRTRPPGRPPQWYSLRITQHEIHLQTGDDAGFRLGATTLRQLLNAGRRAIRAMEIEDWPDFPVRGVMLDISRDKVPTLRTLETLIDLLAGWKINQFQLYTEHTFAYRCHERVWRGASPMTGGQIEHFDQYCRRRGIELVPNQNSFGHMERWLRHAPYAALAEAIGGWETPWGDHRAAPTTLNPLDPRCIRLIRDLYGQLLPHFESRLFNVGCDETWELGQGRSKEACRRRGVGRVYLDFLHRIHREAQRHGRRMLFWADVAFQHPELIQELPRDAIPLLWGYEADHPFDAQCAVLARRGLPFYVCPGTSSWCSFAGRTDNCLANLRNAATAGRAHGAGGYLITDWGDYGHRQYLPVSYCGFLYGAALSWCADTNTRLDVARELSRHAFDDPDGETGRLWLAAAKVHELSGVSLKNRTVLFSCMQADLANVQVLGGLTKDGALRMGREVDALQRTARRTTFPGSDGLLVREELLATLAVLRHACDRAALMLATAGSPPSSPALQRLACGMRAVIKRHGGLWRRRNRPGGLASSLGYYRKNLRQYLSNSRAGSRG